jgi:hypothetical protein
MEVFQEARTLNQGKKPEHEFYDKARNRQVQLWAVKDLSFTEGYGRPVLVVHSHESWTEKKIVGGEKISQPKESDWWWMLVSRPSGFLRTIGGVKAGYQGCGRRRYMPPCAVNQE